MLLVQSVLSFFFFSVCKYRLHQMTKASNLFGVSYMVYLIDLPQLHTQCITDFPQQKCKRLWGKIWTSIKKSCYPSQQEICQKIWYSCRWSKMRRKNPPDIYKHSAQDGTTFRWLGHSTHTETLHLQKWLRPTRGLRVLYLAPLPESNLFSCAAQSAKLSENVILAGQLPKTSYKAYSA